jgi:hypothetical protein
VRAVVEAGVMAIVDAAEGTDAIVAWEVEVVGIRKPTSVVGVEAGPLGPGMLHKG